MVWPFNRNFVNVTDTLSSGPSLKEKLKENRTNARRGSGSDYWDSVINVIAEHYGIHPDDV